MPARRRASPYPRFGRRLFAAALFAGSLSQSLPAAAQQAAFVVGSVVDATTREPLANIRIIATSPSLPGEQAAISDARGHYFIGQLPPGEYTLRATPTVYKSASLTGITLRGGATVRVDMPLVLIDSEAGLERPHPPRAFTIDIGSPAVAVPITKPFAARLPLGEPGALKGFAQSSFEQPALIAPGAFNDPYGVSLSGASSPENRYAIDGLSVSDPAFGLLATPLPMEFASEIRVLTGGISPALGRFTGGAIEVTTKSGGNEIHGSLWTSVTPGAFEGSRTEIPRAPSTIQTSSELSSTRRFGVELGGPILRDRLWFYAGLSPFSTRHNLKRSLFRLVPDATGSLAADAPREPIPAATKTYYADQRGLQYIGKLTYQITDDTRAALSVFGSQETSGGDGSFGLNPLSGQIEVADITGAFSSIANTFHTGTNGASLRLSSAIPALGLHVDGGAGWHHTKRSIRAADGTSLGSGEGLASVAQVTYRRSPQFNIDSHGIEDFERVPGDVCKTVPQPFDSNPMGRTTCPVPLYTLGGPGLLDESALNRYQGNIVVTAFFHALGRHAARAGADLEIATYIHREGFSGGRQLRESLSGSSFLDTRFGYPSSQPRMPVTLDSIESESISTSPGGFLQYDWTIAGAVTLSAGLRFDAQQLSGSNGDLALPFQLSPRIGAIYDITNAGRSRLFANFARYNENVPLHLADRNFPGQPRIQGAYGDSCDPSTPAGQSSNACTGTSNLVPIGPQGTASEFWPVLDNGRRTDIDGDISPQSLNEIVLGGELEIVQGARAGLYYTRRWMNTIIEDASLDDGATFVLVNPGRGRASDFPEATRDYDAFTASIEKDFSDGWLARATYTASHLRGNYPGLFRPETGQLSPNITSEFDLPSLVQNRDGPLPGDRTHRILLFGAKDLRVARWLIATLGASYRAASGAPTNYLGSHFAFGAGETFILSRGSGERLPWTHSIDARLAASFQLGGRRALIIEADIWNIFNFQAATAVDENYTFADVSPVLGGSPESIDCNLPFCPLLYSDGTPFNPIDRNPNFGKPTAYQPPRAVRISARLEF